VLILDEPTEGLDPEQIIEIRNLIRNLRGDHTVILSTHILPEAQALADRIVIIHNGRIVAVDTSENLTAMVQRVQRIRMEVAGPVPAVRDRLKATAGVQRLETLEGEHARFIVESSRDVDLRDKLAAAVVSGGWGLLELERLEPTLEDIFLQMTGKAADEPVSPPAGNGREGKKAKRETVAPEESRDGDAGPEAVEEGAPRPVEEVKS